MLTVSSSYITGSTLFNRLRCAVWPQVSNAGTTGMAIQDNSAAPFNRMVGFKLPVMYNGLLKAAGP